MVNPLLQNIANVGFGSYWWVTDQSEFATDILFKDRAALERIYQDLVNAAITGFGATDVMRFLDRKPHHAFTGEVTIDLKQRPEGCRIKFRLKANSIKIYDHLNVLRIETTINNPREFKVLRVTEIDGYSVRKWHPMGKSVTHFWRYAQVAHNANKRLINALASAPLTGTATEELNSLCQSQTVDGSRVARFNPVDQKTTEIFEAVLAGENAINGFRNRDLQEKLFSDDPKDQTETKRRTHWTSRIIAKLRGHGLIKKVSGSRLYRVTARGIKIMWSAIRFRKVDFPSNFQEVAATLT
jgi:hypothetical protein